MFKYLVLVALLASMVGCGSFGTTSLYRHANDSVSMQKTNRKLKGLPVKLKIPSHVNVTVYEQQVILANSSDIADAQKKASTEAKARVTSQQLLIKSIVNGVPAAAKNIAELVLAIKTTSDLILNAQGAEKEALEVQLAAFKLNLESAKVIHQEAQKKFNSIDKENDILRDLQAKALIAERDAVIKYTLLSFDPAQYVVETELQYTDKVFLVDFKRPVGGVLNLKEASLDDEQYFSKIQAEVEERTLADIGSALDTIKDPLSSLAKKNPNTAVPTSAGTSEGESNDTVNFQKSVVATKRFDISESGWEGRLQGFVNEYIEATQTVVHAPINQISEQQIQAGHGVAATSNSLPAQDNSPYLIGSN